MAYSKKNGISNIKHTHYIKKEIKTEVYTSRENDIDLDSADYGALGHLLKMNQIQANAANLKMEIDYYDVHHEIDRRISIGYGDIESIIAENMDLIRESNVGLSGERFPDENDLIEEISIRTLAKYMNYSQEE